MAGRIEVDLQSTEVTSSTEAVDVVNKAIGHLQAVIEMFKIDQIDDANTAMGNALSCVDEVQDYLERIMAEGT